MKFNSFVRQFLKHKPVSYIPSPGHTVIRHSFAALENDFGISPAVRRAWRTMNPDMLNQYPDRSMTEFRKAAASWLGISADMITVGNGSDELITHIANMVIEPGQSVVIHTPTFFRIIEAIQKMKGRVIAVRANHAQSFALHRSLCERIVHEAKKHRAPVIWLCSPNNPTGAVFRLEDIGWILRHTRSLVVVDEAYMELWDPAQRQSAVRLLKSHTHLIVTKTLSKAFGLAGIRVGLLLAHPDIIRAVDDWRLNFPVSSVSLTLATAALRDTEHLTRISRAIARERKRIITAVQTIPQLEIGTASQTNVLLLRHKTRDIHALLLDEGIMTADFNRMNGLEGLRFVRITVKRHRENTALIAALKTCCGKDSS